jgi:hypothetical protein
MRRRRARARAQGARTVNPPLFDMLFLESPVQQLYVQRGCRGSAALLPPSAHGDDEDVRLDWNMRLELSLEEIGRKMRFTSLILVIRVM